MVTGSNCFDSSGGAGGGSSIPNAFPKIIGSGNGVTKVESVDVAADGRIVVGARTTETTLAGTNPTNTKLVMLYNPIDDVYEWIKRIGDAPDPVEWHIKRAVDVHFAGPDDTKVLVNWTTSPSGQLASGTRRRNLESKSDGE